MSLQQALASQSSPSIRSLVAASYTPANPDRAREISRRMSDISRALNGLSVVNWTTERTSLMVELRTLKAEYASLAPWLS